MDLRMRAGGHHQYHWSGVEHFSPLVVDSMSWTAVRNHYRAAVFEAATTNS
jgi:hypothetical protein